MVGYARQSFNKHDKLKPLARLNLSMLAYGRQCYQTMQEHNKLDTLLELVTSTSIGLKQATVIIDTPSSLLTRVADVMKRVAHVKPEQLVRGWFVRLKAHLDDKLKRLLDRVRQMLSGGE